MTGRWERRRGGYLLRRLGHGRCTQQLTFGKNGGQEGKEALGSPYALSIAGRAVTELGEGEGGSGQPGSPPLCLIAEFRPCPEQRRYTDNGPRRRSHEELVLGGSVELGNGREDGVEQRDARIVHDQSGDRVHWSSGGWDLLDSTH
jgi:hypothetical protein